MKLEIKLDPLNLIKIFMLDNILIVWVAELIASSECLILALGDNDLIY